MDSDIKIFITPEAKNSKLPLKHAISIAIFNPQQEILIAIRSQNVGEFKGVWSLPSKFIEEKDNSLETLKYYINLWFKLEIKETKLIRKRIAIRPKWRLEMNLFLANTTKRPCLNTKKYDEVKWVKGVDYFSHFKYESLGDCAKSFLNYMNQE